MFGTISCDVVAVLRDRNERSHSKDFITQLGMSSEPPI